MKPTTTAIQAWINNPTYKTQMESIFSNSVNFTVYETSIVELKEQFDFCIEQLIFLIEKGELDNLTFHKRNSINTTFKNLTAQLVQAKRYNYNLTSVTNVGNTIFSYILSLRDQLDTILFYIKGKGVSDYLNESKEFIKIRKKYSKLINDIGQVEAEKDKIIESNKVLLKKITELQTTTSTLQQNSKTISNLNNQIETLYNKIKSNSVDIESKKITISSIHKSAKELEKIFENANSQVKSLGELSSKSIKDFIDVQTKLVNAKNLENINKTDKLITKNESLQDKINTLLEGANAGELYKAFNSRKKDIEITLNKWFLGIIGINLFLVLFTLLIINGSTWLSIKALNPNSMDSAFYLKLFISIPLIFLDWFIIRQYNQRKDLAEKYAFKSVLSLSLLAYNEMMIDNKENQISLEFISNTVEKIYQSPFDSKELTKKELEVLNKLAEKGIDKIDSLKKILD